MLQLINVQKLYGDSISAVKDVSFKVEEGEFVFLIGPSGSGKTTVIKMLIREEVPTDGKIYFNDRDITHVSRDQVYKFRREIGVIFQDYKLVPDKTAFENVAFAMEAAGKSNKEIKETVPYVLDIVGLSNRIEAFPRELSGGEQQRVAIARAIANNPKILIADEPTGNLDPASAWDIVQILSKINNWGTTVIMSTHGTEIVNSLNKRVIQMDKGLVVRDDNRGQYELTTTYELKINESAEKNKSATKKTKQVFKVKIDSEEDKVEPVVEEKKSFWQKLFNFGKKQEAKPHSIEEVLQNNVEETIEKSEIESNKLTSSLLEGLDEEKKDNQVSTGKKKKLKDRVKSKDKEERNQKSTAKSELKDSENNKKSTKNSASSNLAQKIDAKQTTLDDINLEFDSINHEVYEKIKEIKVVDLKIPKQVKKDLKVAGYKNVGEIIESGPDGLSEKLVIDPEEIILIAKSIDKLIKEYDK